MGDTGCLQRIPVMVSPNRCCQSMDRIVSLSSLYELELRRGILHEVAQARYARYLGLSEHR